MSNSTANSASERRSYYRADDDVYLEYLVLNSSEVANAIDEFRNDTRGHFNPLNQLHAIGIRNRPLLDEITRENPAIGAYLVSIDERIQLLAHAIAQDQAGVPIVPNESVNISGGGIAFGSDLAIPSDSCLEFSIIIVPSYLHIYALGKVVYCGHNKNGNDALPYRIGVEFTHIHDADRDALIRHVSERGTAP